MKKTFYVACPAYLVTGGTELLHQLVFKLNNILKERAYIFYINVDWKFEVPLTPKRFEKYVGNNWKTEIEDTDSSVLIVPEICPYLLFEQKNAFKVLWWLSVDNFYVQFSTTKEELEERTFKNYIKKVLNRFPFRGFYTVLYDKRIDLHLCQSEYANLFLEKMKIYNRMSLSDYINTDVVIQPNSSLISKRKNQVLYNPYKGFSITKELIQLANGKIEWIPLEKLDAIQIGTLMRESKIYIDFGNHPGKDRIPREAVLNDCIIITNRKGGAKNDLDIPIPEKYKFENPLYSSQKIIELIFEIFDTYENRIGDFVNYKSKIMNEEVVFENDLKNLVTFLYGNEEV